MNMLPIVRFSQKEYLEELQQGHLFLPIYYLITLSASNH